MFMKITIINYKYLEQKANWELRNLRTPEPQNSGTSELRNLRTSELRNLRTSELL